jgi:hypothetical protein
VIRIDGLVAGRFAVSFAAAQAYADEARSSEVGRLYAINHVREELQNIFEILPEDIQLKILEILRNIGDVALQPPLRKVKRAD